jgi:hypothetical protein
MSFADGGGPIQQKLTPDRGANDEHYEVHPGRHPGRQRDRAGVRSGPPAPVLHRDARGPGNEAGGKDTGIALQTADIDAYHAELEERGADVDSEISRMGDPVPPIFWLRDPEGNSLMVVEVR